MMIIIMAHFDPYGTNTSIMKRLLESKHPTNKSRNVSVFVKLH